jgi:MATE family, multidrug efflux pump
MASAAALQNQPPVSRVLQRLTQPWARASGDRPVARDVWVIAWPAITHMALVTLVFLVGRAMVARWSSTALASLQISSTLVWSAYSLCTAFSTGTLAVVARSVGEGDRAGAARAARASLLFALVVGVAVFLPIRAANGALLRLLFPEADAAVLAEAGAYLHIVLPILPLAFVEASAAACLQGAGDTRTPLVVAALGNVVNVALSAVLIFGLAGAPALGVRGAAIGHAATMGIEGLLLAGALLSRGSPLPLRESADGALQALRRVLAVSVPAFAEKALYHAGYLAYVAMIGLLGTKAMGANQVLVSIEAICFLSADGFGIAAGAVVAQKLGAGREREAARAAAFAAAMAMALLSAFAVLFAAAPAPLVSAFSPDADIVSIGARALLVAAFAQPFMAFATVTAMALRGAGDTRTVLGISGLCSVVVRLGATWLFAIHWGHGLAGAWIGSTLDWVARTLLLGVAFAAGRWRRVAV